MLKQLVCDNDEKCISLILFDWVNGYTKYAFKFTDGLIAPCIYGPRTKFATNLVGFQVELVAAQNKNIKVICSIKCWAELSLTNSKTSLLYERWTSRGGNCLPGLTAPGGNPLARRLCARQAAPPDLREPAMVPYFKHRPQGSAWHTLTRSLLTKCRSYKLFDSIGLFLIIYCLNSLATLHLLFSF